MITRVLFFLLGLILFSTVLWNGNALTNYTDSLNMASDASAAFEDIPAHKDTLVKVSKPTFMELEKSNQAELTSQVKIGYFLLRGF